jgi:hypothetical protein
MDAARVHLDAGAADLYDRLASPDTELSHAESLEVLDTLIAALEERNSSVPNLPASLPASVPKLPASSPTLPPL